MVNKFSMCLVLALALLVSACVGCGAGSGPSSGQTTTYYNVTVQLNGVVGTLSSSSVAAGGTFTITGVGPDASHKAPVTATGCTLTGTTCAGVVANADVIVTLTAPAATYTISGKITGGVVAGVNVSFGGNSVVTGADGSYSYSGFSNGSYTVTPSLAGFTFNPTFATAVVSGANVANVNFVATKNVAMVTPTVKADYGILVPSNVTAQDGQPVSITATPADGYALTGATGCDTFSTTTGKCTINKASSTTTVWFKGGTVGDVSAINWFEGPDSVVRDNELKTKKLSFTISTYGSAVVQAKICSQPTFSKTASTQCFPMDDGKMSGGEHLFTITDHVVGLVPVLQFDNHTIGSMSFDFHIFDSAGKELSPGTDLNSEGGRKAGLNPTLEFGIIDHTLPDVNMQQLSSTVSVSTNSSANFVDVVMPLAFDNSDGSSAIIAEVCKYVDCSSTDTVIIRQVGSTWGGNIPHFGLLCNEVTGIGLQIVPCTSSLKGIGVLTPSEKRGSSTVHEGEGGHLTSCYTADVCDSERHFTPNSFTPGPMSNINNGILTPKGSGYTLVAPTDNKPAVCQNLSPWERYKAGYTLTFQSGVSLDPNYVIQGADIPATAVHVVDGNSNINANGPRSPQLADPNPHVLVISWSKRPKTPAELVYEGRFSQWYASTTEQDTAMDTQGATPVCSAPPLHFSSGGYVTVDNTVKVK